MQISNIVKETGATFTPKGLSDFLANRILFYTTTKNITVLDPACGEGELLISIGEKLKKINSNFNLIGFDSNKYFINEANKRINLYEDMKIQFKECNFLELNKKGKNGNSIDLVDVIIANPPYVRTQILGSKVSQDLSNNYGLKGRIDLYYAFLIAMTESLKIDGILGVITSNRYLSTKSGATIRGYLMNSYEILELIDLGDTKLFDASVLPAILIGRKRKLNPDYSKAKFTKIYEQFNECPQSVKKVEDIYSILNSYESGYFQVNSKIFKKTDGKLKQHRNNENTWEMLTEKETKWVYKIDKNAKYRIGEFFKVRVGIKTTADSIFISDKWDELGEKKPEEDLLKDLISQENIKPWILINEIRLKVLYPYYSKNGIKKLFDLEKYPKTMEYLRLHKDKLKQRKYLIEAGREWYEIWVPQKPELWSYPKLIFPDISINPRFYFDEKGKIVNGNCYWIVAEKKTDIDLLLLIQGVSNSNLITKYHDLVFNNKLYSGRRRYFSQYVEKYPIPEIDSEPSKDIIKIVKDLNNHKGNKSILLKNLEIKVAEAFDVDPILTLKN